jgi:hypothetical protein
VNVVSWDGYDINDGTVYQTGLTSPILSQAPVVGNMVQRHGRFPLVGGVSYPGKPVLLTTILLSADATDRAALRTIFETESGEIKTLIIEGDDGTEQYIQALCEAHYEEDEVGNVFYALLRVHDDPAWRSTAVQTDTESVTATGQQWTITNDGDQIARPVITITPTDAKSGSNPYRRFMAVHWLGDAAEKYPVDICGNALDTQTGTTNFDSTDGHDIRVFVNGVTVDYWLDDINSADTSIWINLNFQAAIALTLATAIASTGTVETIDVNEDIADMPPQGILQIGSEFFLYTAKNNALQRFTVLSRAAHGSSMAAHSVDDDVLWLQHDIQITYGNDANSAYPVDNTEQPIITLASSTNAAFDYDNFWSATVARYGRTRTWQWARPSAFFDITIDPPSWRYTGYGDSQFSGYPSGDPFATSPAAVAGIMRRNSATLDLFWRLYCPCGLSAFNFSNGYKRINTGLTGWRAYILTATAQGTGDEYPFTEYTIPAPSAANAWETWSRSQSTSLTDARYLMLAAYPNLASTTGQFVEASDCLVTFDSSLIPAITIGAEQGNYTVDAVLTHVESGWALQIHYPMQLDESLEIDTGSGAITDLSNGSSQFQAVKRLPRPRVEWLPLRPGTNTLQWDETDVAGVDVTFDWRERRGA